MPQQLYVAAHQALSANAPARAESLARQALARAPGSGPLLHLLGQSLFLQDKHQEAAACLLAAVEAMPNQAGPLNSLGAALYAVGAAEEAEPFLAAAAALAPSDPVVRFNFGNALRAIGKPRNAEQEYREALQSAPNLASLWCALSVVLADLGKPSEAETAARRAVALTPDDAAARHQLGAALQEQGRGAEAEEQFLAALVPSPCFVPALRGLAMARQSTGDIPGALSALEKAYAMTPEDAGAAFELQALRSSLVAGWHIPMINDLERNDAYDEALRRQVRPGQLVLEIGTGSAIVAMMAARAGAAKVVTCEINPALAAAAVRTVARNGYADRISVVHKKSTALTLPEDLPEKADLFVSELINIGMLAPDMLRVLRHARENLVKPDGIIIPAASTLHAMLIQCDGLARVNPVKTINGFDLSEMDAFRSPGYAQIDLAAEPHRRLSADFSPLYFDFRLDGPDKGEIKTTVTATEAGLCHGVAFWFDLDMGAGVVYRSGSLDRANHWKQAIEFFPQPISVAPGDQLDVIAAWDHIRISFRPA